MDLDFVFITFQFFFFYSRVRYYAKLGLLHIKPIHNIWWLSNLFLYMLVSFLYYKCNIESKYLTDIWCLKDINLIFLESTKNLNMRKDRRDSLRFWRWPSGRKQLWWHELWLALADNSYCFTFNIEIEFCCMVLRKAGSLRKTLTLTL